MKIETNDLNISNNKKIAQLVTILWGFDVITNFVNTVVNLVVPNTPWDTIICYFIFFVFIAIAFKPIVCRLKLNDVVVLLVVIGVFVFSLLFYPSSYKKIVDIMPTFFFTVLTFYFLGKAITDFGIIINYLKPMSRIIILLAFLHYLIILLFVRTTLIDDMSFSYKLLPSVIFIIFLSFEEGGIKNWLFALIGITVTVLAGTRGPIICILCFVLMYFILGLQKGINLVKFCVVLIATILIIFNKNIPALVSQINVYLLKNGISNRIIQKYLNNEFQDSSGRDVIYDMVLAGIKKHPFIGYGIMGDRNLTKGFEFSSSSDPYAHNIVLELLCQFGIIIGSILLIIILILLIRAIYIEKDWYVINFILILISVGFVKLFFTGSYLNESYLFLLLGVCVSIVKEKSRKGKMIFH